MDDLWVPDWVGLLGGRRLGAGLARGAGAAGRVGAPTGLERCRRFSGGGTGWAAPVAATSGPAFMLSGLQVERRRVMLGQDIGNGMQMALATFGTQRWIDALTGEEVVDVGDVGLGRIGEAEEGATLHQALLTLAVDEKAVEADTMEALYALQCIKGFMQSRWLCRECRRGTAAFLAISMDRGPKSAD